MQIEIDTFTDSTPWVASGNVTIGKTDAEGYVAGWQDEAFLVKFPQGSALEFIRREDIDIDVSECDQLVVSVWSRNKKRTQYYTFEDCPYEIMINDTHVFGLRVWPTMTEETIDLEGIDKIETLQITALHDDDDYLLLSYMVASRDDLPFDLFEGTKKAIELVREEYWPGGLYIGKANVQAGDRVLNVVGNISHLWRYTAIRLVEGGVEEIHQLGDLTEKGFALSHLFDGESIQNTMADADVHLLCPVRIYQTEHEVSLPSVTLYGMEPVPVMRGSEEDRTILAPRDTGAVEVEQDKIVEWPINVDIASRSLELNAMISSWVRRMLNEHVIWVNGRKFTVSFEDAAREELPNVSFDVIPKLAYTITVEVKERTWRKNRTNRSSAMISVSPRP